MAMACEVPTMLPVPTVAARAVVTACSGVTAPCPASCFLKSLPAVFRMAKPKCLNCTAPLPMVRYRPPMNTQGSRMYSHATSLSVPARKL